MIKDCNRVWTILGQHGCGWYTEQNTVLLDTTLHTASHLDSVHWMRPWKPQELGAEELNCIDEELSRKLLAPSTRALASRNTSVSLQCCILTTTVTGIGQTFHEVFVQCCFACEWYRRLHKQVLAILMVQQVQVIALGRQ